jgi:hypothetical protein
MKNLELPEQIKKLPFQERRELIKKIASSKAGQALREELVDIMNDVGNVCKVPDYAWSNNEVLASEARGRDIARGYLQGVYNFLIPEPEEKEITKIHK